MSLAPQNGLRSLTLWKFKPKDSFEVAEAVHIYSPFLKVEMLRDQALTVFLDTGEEIDGYCQNVDSPAWLLFRQLEPDEPHS